MSKVRSRIRWWFAHGVKMIGYSNTPAHLPADASALFARNLYNFLSAFWDKEAGQPGAAR
jgi:NAD(P) transhydrogenase subunit alpha